MQNSNKTKKVIIIQAIASFLIIFAHYHNFPLLFSFNVLNNWMAFLQFGMTENGIQEVCLLIDVYEDETASLV
jgi:hypothetical protein